MTNLNHPNHDFNTLASASVGLASDRNDAIEWSNSIWVPEAAPTDPSRNTLVSKRPTTKLSNKEVLRVVNATRELGLATRIGANALQLMINDIGQYKKDGYFDSHGLSIRALDSEQPLAEVNFLPVLIDEGHIEDSAGSSPRHFAKQKNFALIQAIQGAQSLAVGVQSGIVDNPGRLIGLTNSSMSKIAGRFGLQPIDKSSNMSLIKKLHEPVQVNNNLSAAIRSRESEESRRAQSAMLNMDVVDSVLDPKQILVSGNYEDLQQAILTIPNQLQERIAKMAISEVSRAGLEV